MHQLTQFRDYLLLLANHELKRLGENRLDAMDLVQETFARAQQHWEQYHGSTDAELAGWLRAILTNHLKDLLKKQGRETDEQRLMIQLDESAHRLEHWLACAELTPRRKTLHNELLLLVSSALLELPEQQRIAIELRYIRGMSIDEICELMQRTPGSVGGLLQRGLATLRERLEST